MRAVNGTVTPVIPGFEAMGTDHRSYPVLWQLASPAGIPAATLAEGATATGKVWLDVTGADPAAVIYTRGGARPAMMWCDMAAMAPMMAMPMDDCPCCAVLTAHAVRASREIGLRRATRDGPPRAIHHGDRTPRKQPRQHPWATCSSSGRAPRTGLAGFGFHPVKTFMPRRSEITSPALRSCPR